MRYAVQPASRQRSPLRTSTPREWMGIVTDNMYVSGDDGPHYFPAAGRSASAQRRQGSSSNSDNRRHSSWCSAMRPPTRAPWNSSVRTGSPLGPSASTPEVSLRATKRFGASEDKSSRRVSRRLASSLEDGDGVAASAWGCANTTSLAVDDGRHHNPQRSPPSHSMERELHNLHNGKPHAMEECEGRLWASHAQTPPPLPRRPANRHSNNRNRGSVRTTGALAALTRAKAMHEENVAAVAPVDTAAADAQIRLYAQLQRVVVELSASAVRQRHTAAHAKKQLEAYAALVREQDALIDQLRHENASVVREKDALLAFRRRGLTCPLGGGPARTAGGGTDEDHREGVVGGTVDELAQPTDEQLDAWVRAEYDRCNHIPPYQYAETGARRRSGQQHQRPHTHPMDELSPATRSLVRSIAWQLCNERSRRLDVEEQSSRMIGQQQLALERLETRLLRRAGGTPRSPHRALAEATRFTAITDDDVAGDIDEATVSPSSASDSRGSTHGGTACAHSCRPPLPPPASAGVSTSLARVSDRGSPSPVSSPRGAFGAPAAGVDPYGIPPDSRAYEDAEAILADIRQRYNLA